MAPFYPNRRDDDRLGGSLATARSASSGDTFDEHLVDVELASDRL
jgi:hypothetical protein